MSLAFALVRLVGLCIFVGTIVIATTLAILNWKILGSFGQHRDELFVGLHKETLARKKANANNGGASTSASLSVTKNETDEDEDGLVIGLIAGFFHPYCDAGGGGERVLWTAIRDIQVSDPTIVSVVYTGDITPTTGKFEILSKVKARFNIELDPSKISFVSLKKRSWIEDAKWPRFTLVGQSLGSMILGWEALNQLVPDIWIDTMGYAFTYPVARMLGGATIAAYVHYPSISSDMIGRVASRETGNNNSQAVAKSPLYTVLKLVYYRLFSMFYSLAGSYAHVVMTNSSWTKAHIDKIWQIKSDIVYPPCDTEAFKDFPLEGRERVVVSVAQFRPEKGHGLQLEAMAELFKQRPEFKGHGEKSVKLVMVGSARNAGDEQRIQDLKDQSVTLGIEDNVQFVINAPFPELKEWLKKSKVGIHAMRDEHFGIGVVEYMAAGLIPVAHDSAGPKMDIVAPYKGQPTGYLASTPETFAKALAKVLDLPEGCTELLEMQQRARESVQERFSEKVFETRFQGSMHKLLSGEQIVIDGVAMFPHLDPEVQKKEAAAAAAAAAKKEL